MAFDLVEFHTQGQATTISTVDDGDLDNEWQDAAAAAEARLSLIFDDKQKKR